ncbi:MAG TPA: putative Ig domain-containing protein [Anaeromyxobacteraceae bacterium]|nr:putative Ig domain-containing protein [Anaeromyxobacteraceae bacterium]
MHARRSGSAALSTLAIAALSLALTSGCSKEDKPGALAYSTNPAVYTKGLSIAANVPSWPGGSPSSFSVTPALPAGLSLNPATGAITGKPTAVSATASYTVTARGGGDTASVSLSITVDARLAVLFTTDEHSHVFAAAPEVDDFPLPTSAGSGSLKGGVARRATLLANERAAGAQRGVETITVSAGDSNQGTLAAVLLTQTNPDLAFEKLLGYDAIAIGNHDFELGLPALAAAIVAAPPAPPAPIPPLPATFTPYVLTNVTFDAVSTADDAVAALYGEKGAGKPIERARVITTAGGLKVGIVAALGRGAASSSALAAPITFTSGIDPLDPTKAGAALDAIALQLQAAIDDLRSADAVDAVVLLGHGGIGATAAIPGDDELLATKLKGVDLIVSGHTHAQPDAVRYATDLDGREVPIMQPAPYGSEVGRAELAIHATGRPTLDTTASRTRFIAVDDRILPSQDPTLRYVLATVVGGLESVDVAALGGMTFLEANLSVITGGLVTDDPAVLGDLYYYGLGSTTYDVIGLGSGETNGSDLDTDAMLSAANAVASTQIALQNRGAIRGDLVAGETGELSFADVYRVVPNGGDPVEGSPGYPLIRAYLLAGEIFGALDTTAKKAVEDGDFFLVPSGLRYEYDSSRPLTPMGSWIKKIDLVDATGTVTTPIYDETLTSTGGWAVNPTTTLVSLVTTLYVGEFAKFAGVTPRDQFGVPIADLTTVILTRGDGSHVKDYQALAKYVRDQCAANTAAPGFLPTRYGDPVPRRALCTGPLCQQ